MRYSVPVRLKKEGLRHVARVTEKCSCFRLRSSIVWTVTTTSQVTRRSCGLCTMSCKHIDNLHILPNYHCPVIGSRTSCTLQEHNNSKINSSIAIYENFFLDFYSFCKHQFEKHTKWWYLIILISKEIDKPSINIAKNKNLCHPLSFCEWFLSEGHSYTIQ